MTNVLTPTPKQKFFTNNGAPAVAYKLFTYQAGTSTKLTTYQDTGTGSPNANPIPMDFRGECNLWIPPNVSYKYVFAAPNDTDPPSNPLWTVDNLVNSQLITLYGGVDVGTSNAYVINFVANFTAYSDGIVIYWIPSNNNTGASTINVNGLGPVAIVNQNGTPLTHDQLAANQVATIMYKGTGFLLLSAGTVLLAGSFTGTLAGMTTAITGTISYKIFGNRVTLSVGGAITGTSNTTSMQLSGLPSEVVSAVGTAQTVKLRDSGADIGGWASLSAGASAITFGTGINDNTTGFTGAGQKGLPGNWSFNYPLS